MDDIQDFISSVKRFQSRIQQSDIQFDKKVIKVNQLFVLVIVTISDETKVQFTSLFSRLAYLISTFKIPYKEGYLLHTFRKHELIHVSNKEKYELGQLTIHILLHYCLRHSADLSEVSELFQSFRGDQSSERPVFIKSLKVQFTSIDIEKKRIQANNCIEPFDEVIIAYNRSDRNEDFTGQLEVLNKNELLPLTVNLIAIEIDKEGVLYPSMMVFEPDFLYDVTAISECFGPFANHEAGYLLRKFKKKPLSKAILIGNISNFFLDELIINPGQSFLELTNRIFIQDPLAIALLSDEDVRDMMQSLKRHFLNIQMVVSQGLPQINISKEDCFIEPSFYSSKYGIQGRLDLFAINDKNATIIELKSGSVYRPNSYGLANNHYHQTLIYDLLIESVYGSKVNRNNFILYSKESKNSLRYAPALKSEQREAIKVRNALYLHDRQLLESEDFIAYYLEYARANRPKITGYAKSDFIQFLNAFRELDQLERSYCNALFRFSLRELFINKLGDEGADRSTGLAAMWNQNTSAKIEQFNILNNLTINENSAWKENPQLKLSYSDMTAPLSNFRVGDLGVLYPVKDEMNDVLRHQIFKVTILSINEREVTIRLRSRQENSEIFNLHNFWHIEHDSLDNGFYEMTRNIYEFAQANEAYRQLIMGRRPPQFEKFAPVHTSANLTTEQKLIFSKIIAAPEYYLLWGPPGTGKTSVMLRELAKHYIAEDVSRILLLAYTNRAVDEICAALLSIDDTLSFIRVGSKYGTAERYHEYLLGDQISEISSRKELRNKLKNTKVYVGTIASVSGKNALFDLISFDTAIIDEASQILESSLIGILSRVKKFVLIGDHFQLPAIVRQDDKLTEIEDRSLLSLGIKRLSSSLFERLYLSALENKWEHAIGQLKFQGRMHEEIMNFANDHFYNHKLLSLPVIERLTIQHFFSDSSILKERISFYNTPVDDKSESIKVNEFEADKVTELCLLIIDQYKDAGMEINRSSIGVITPYRAQIAAIKRKLRKTLTTAADLITVDTVERYQGGARDIIIMSACMNYSFQLKSLISLSAEGIDRKLNVAITRAREHFILVGNASILVKNEVYKELVKLG